MANLIKTTPNYAYIEMHLDARLFSKIVERFGGNPGQALRELRVCFNSLAVRLASERVQDAQGRPSRVL